MERRRIISIGLHTHLQEDTVNWCSSWYKSDVKTPRGNEWAKVGLFNFLMAVRWFSVTPPHCYLIHVCLLFWISIPEPEPKQWLILGQIVLSHSRKRARAGCRARPDAQDSESQHLELPSDWRTFYLFFNKPLKQSGQVLGGFYAMVLFKIWCELRWRRLAEKRQRPQIVHFILK